MEDLKLVTFKFDFKCSYLIANNSENSSYYVKHFKYCLKIVPYAQLYKKQIEYYHHTAYSTLTNDIELILGIASSMIGLTYEGILSFLHHKRHKALHKAVKIMEKKSELQCNKMHHLEDTMIMYGVHNSDTLTGFIDMVHRMPLGKR